MAPDLNAVGKGERWDYSTPGSSGYDIPDIVYNVSLCSTKSLRQLMTFPRTHRRGSLRS